MGTGDQDRKHFENSIDFTKKIEKPKSEDEIITKVKHELDQLDDFKD